MKKLFVLFALACVVLQGAQILTQGQESDSNKLTPGAVHEHELILAITRDLTNAYNTGDASKVASLYAEDGYYRSAHTFARGRKAIETYCRRGIEAGSHFNIVGPQMVFASEGFGYTSAPYQVTNAGATVDGRVVLIFRKIDGNWLIAAHETLVPDQP